MKPISSADLEAEAKEFLCEGCGDYHSVSEKIQCDFCHTAYCISCYGDMESHPCASQECFEAVRNEQETFNPSKRNKDLMILRRKKGI